MSADHDRLTAARDRSEWAHEVLLTVVSDLLASGRHDVVADVLGWPRTTAYRHVAKARAAIYGKPVDGRSVPRSDRVV